MADKQVRWWVVLLAVAVAFGAVPLRRLVGRLFARGDRAIPLVVVADSHDDGAASLAMVLAYHGKPATVDELRPTVNIEPDGRSNALAIVETAERRGMAYVRGVQVGRIDLESTPRGSILHLREERFVVLDGFDGGSIRVLSPVAGRQRHRIDDYWREMSGVVLIFEEWPN